jgi:hypothetical protein
MTFPSVIFDNNYQEEYSEITSLKHCRLNPLNFIVNGENL